MAALRAMAVDVWMVTGDNHTTAEAIGDELGIGTDRIIAGATLYVCVCVCVCV